jgi:hypothetical protein
MFNPQTIILLLRPRPFQALLGLYALWEALGPRGSHLSPPHGDGILRNHLAQKRRLGKFVMEDQVRQVTARYRGRAESG